MMSVKLRLTPMMRGVFAHMSDAMRMSRCCAVFTGPGAWARAAPGTTRAKPAMATMAMRRDGVATGMEAPRLGRGIGDTPSGAV